MLQVWVIQKGWESLTEIGNHPLRAELLEVGHSLAQQGDDLPLGRAWWGGEGWKREGVEEGGGGRGRGWKREEMEEGGGGRGRGVGKGEEVEKMMTHDRGIL